MSSRFVSIAGSISCKIFNVIHLITDFFGNVTDFLILALTFIITVSVIMRYFFKMSVAWSTEIGEYALFLMVILGAAWVLKEDGHIKMDLVINALSPRNQNWLNLINNILGVFVCIIFVYYGCDATYQSYLQGTVVQKFMQLPRYIFLFFIPFGFTLMTFQFIYNLFATVKQLYER